MNPDGFRSEESGKAEVGFMLYICLPLEQKCGDEEVNKVIAEATCVFPLFVLLRLAVLRALKVVLGWT